MKVEVAERIYLGTWQFEAVDEKKKIQLIDHAQSLGVTHFDTAKVYDQGRAEELLGKYADPTSTIVTKVPALQRDLSTVSIEAAYLPEHIEACLQASRDRIGDQELNVLLHNWDQSWEGDFEGQEAVLTHLVSTALRYGISEVGISLPNRYVGSIETTPFYQGITIIEAPFNATTPAIDESRLRALAADKTVLARSLLQHGRSIDNISSKLATVIKAGAYPVVGATKESQMTEWVRA